MTQRHFEIFCTVCNYLSMTKAAEELNMTQPSVSIAIRELEAHYNTKLFDRCNRKLYITESGKLLRNYANSILNQYCEVQTILRNETIFNHCCLGVNYEIGETLLPDIIFQIQNHFPNITVAITVDKSSAIEKKLESNKLDFALFDSYTQNQNRVTTPLYQDKMITVCSTSYKCPSHMTLEELALRPLILRESGSANRSEINHIFKKRGILVTPFVESASNLCIINLLKKGLGISILPHKYVLKEIQAGIMKEIDITNASFERRYFLVCNKNKYLSSSTKQVMNTILNFFNNYQPQA